MAKCILEGLIDNFQEQIEECKNCKNLLQCADWFQALGLFMEGMWVQEKNLKLIH